MVTMNIKPIKTKEDNRAALARISEIFDAEPNTPEGDELDVLATLVEAFEDAHYPTEKHQMKLDDLVSENMTLISLITMVVGITLGLIIF